MTLWGAPSSVFGGYGRAVMKLLEDMIIKYGKVFPGNVLKVDNFLNHQVDIELADRLGEELSRLYTASGITKVLTLEASGIVLACFAAKYLKVPMIFAKKTKTSNISDNLYFARVHSYTRGVNTDIVVSKEYLNGSDKVLVVDDFLATGSALAGLIDIANQAGAKVAGAGIAIEKGYQGGGDKLRADGIRVESLAIIENMDKGVITFRR